MVPLGSQMPVLGAEAQPGRVKIEYVAPKDPGHQALYDLLKQRRALEDLQRLFSPFRLPTDLTIQIAGCDGIANAWYERAGVTLCYELLSLISRPIPKDVAWAGIRRKTLPSGSSCISPGMRSGTQCSICSRSRFWETRRTRPTSFPPISCCGWEATRRAGSYLEPPTTSESISKTRDVTTQLKAFSDAHSQAPAEVLQSAVHGVRRQLHHIRRVGHKGISTEATRDGLSARISQGGRAPFRP